MAHHKENLKLLNDFKEIMIPMMEDFTEFQKSRVRILLPSFLHVIYRDKLDSVSCSMKSMCNYTDKDFLPKITLVVDPNSSGGRCHAIALIVAALFVFMPDKKVAYLADTLRNYEIFIDLVKSFVMKSQKDDDIVNDKNKLNGNITKSIFYASPEKCRGLSSDIFIMEDYNSNREDVFCQVLIPMSFVKYTATISIRCKPSKEWDKIPHSLSCNPDDKMVRQVNLSPDLYPF